jgi:asparagine synthase (glutamine-hydrolysing)
LAPRGFTCGDQHITAYDHPHVTAHLLTTVNRVAVIATTGSVRRRVETLRGAAYRRLFVEITEQASDWISAEITETDIRFTAGIGGIAPLYLAAAADTLGVSWDSRDVVPLARRDELDAIELTRRLTMSLRYSSHTMWSNVRLLTERGVAVWDGDRLRLSYPEHATHSAARRLVPGVDPIPRYEQLLEQARSRVDYHPATTAVQLSGGLDSANVAMTLAAAHVRQIRAAAVVFPGRVGVYQQRRRHIMIDRARLLGDIAVASEQLAPLHPASQQLHGVLNPCEEMYAEATHAVHDELAAAGIRTVFTGLGGDEMVALTHAERPRAAIGIDRGFGEWIGPAAIEAHAYVDDDIAPSSIVNEMTLVAFTLVAPALLRRGILPVHLFADPDIIRFGEWLPMRWRRLKRLHRVRLQRLGYTRSIWRPRVQENFADLIGYSVVHHFPPLLRELLRDGSPLIDAGFINPDGLGAAIERIEAGHVQRRDGELFDVLAVHHGAT